MEEKKQRNISWWSK